MEVIEKYFVHLTDRQKGQFDALGALYSDWNSKINVISRKDIGNLYIHHVLHSLSIAKYISFVPTSKILDVGTGGGFPGIPLAILFPECSFLLIDSIGKKIKVAVSIAASIGLSNVTCRQIRVQNLVGKFDFVVSRAVMKLPQLAEFCKKNISPNDRNALPNGIIALKGGDLEEEKKPFNNIVEEVNLFDYFEEEFFQTKKLLYLPR